MKLTALALFCLSLAFPSFADPLADPFQKVQKNGAAAKAAPAPEAKPADLMYQKVHEAAGLTKPEIYNRALEWMAKNFTDSKAVIEIKDPENGKILGKGVTFVRAVLSGFECRFTMAIEIKDGRYRATYDDFRGTTYDYPVTALPMVERIKAENMAPLDDSLAAAINAKKSDAW